MILNLEQPQSLGSGDLGVGVGGVHGRVSAAAEY